MSTWWWVLAVGVAGAVVAAVTVWPVIARRRAASRLRRARQLFQLRREWLEARFFQLASESGRPRGLRWTDCDFENGVAYAKDRATGHLRAFVAMTIRFEAVEGGDMEDNPNAGNVRAATAVFQFDGRQWTTDGRAIFNLDPQQAIKRFEHEVDAVE